MVCRPFSVGISSMECKRRRIRTVSSDPGKLRPGKRTRWTWNDQRTFVEVADAEGLGGRLTPPQLGEVDCQPAASAAGGRARNTTPRRTTRGAALTEAGTTFREHAARICTEVDAALEAVAVGGELRALLRVAVYPPRSADALRAGHRGADPSPSPTAISTAATATATSISSPRASMRHPGRLPGGFEPGRAPHRILLRAAVRKPGLCRHVRRPRDAPRRARPSRREIATETWTFSAGGKPFPRSARRAASRADSAVAIAEATAAGGG